MVKIIFFQPCLNDDYILKMWNYWHWNIEVSHTIIKCLTYTINLKSFRAKMYYKNWLKIEHVEFSFQENKMYHSYGIFIIKYFYCYHWLLMSKRGKWQRIERKSNSRTRMIHEKFFLKPQIPLVAILRSFWWNS